MATKINLAILAMATLVALLHTTDAQTEYIVGDSLGWLVPPGGSIAYSTWAANKTFMVGDTLVFNFVNGTQDVAIVDRDEYQDCDEDIDSDDIISIFRTSPAKIVLNSAGAYYFTSTYQRHCQMGQKLAINVVARTTTPPTPPPARGPITYTVGDNLGWLVPPGGPAAYYTWALNKTFMVGDTLVFNFVNGTQDVALVTRDEYDDCDGDIDAEDIISVYRTSPATVILNSTGDYFFTSTYRNHCELGQKLAINVIPSTAGTPPSGSAPSPPPATNPPASPPPPPRTPVTYTVGDNLTWIVPPGGSVAYIAWAYNKSFVVGDTLVFNFVNGTQDVAIVNKEDYYDCDTDGDDVIAVYRTSPVRIILNTTGEHFFTSTYDNHCEMGQKLAINVTAASTTVTPPPSTTTPSPSSSPAPPLITTTPASGGPNSETALPPSSSAPSKIAAGFLLTLLSIVVALAQ